MRTNTKFTTAAMLAQRGLGDRDVIEANCARGEVAGAFFDRITWQWWIPVASLTAMGIAFEEAGLSADHPVIAPDRDLAPFHAR